MCWRKSSVFWLRNSKLKLVDLYARRGGARRVTLQEGCPVHITTRPSSWHPGIMAITMDPKPPNLHTLCSVNPCARRLFLQQYGAVGNREESGMRPPLSGIWKDCRALSIGQHDQDKHPPVRRRLPHWEYFASGKLEAVCRAV